MDERKESRLGKLRILAIDDDEIVQRVYVACFRNEDEVRVVSTCKEGLDVFLEDPMYFHGVITDLNQEPLSGIDVVRGIRSSANPVVPVYIITGGSTRTLETQAQELVRDQSYITRHVMKPFRVMELHAQMISDIGRTRGL